MSRQYMSMAVQVEKKKLKKKKGKYLKFFLTFSFVVILKIHILKIFCSIVSFKKK